MTAQAGARSRVSITVMAHYLILKCPQCGDWIDAQMLGISSGLGRPRVTCVKCNAVIETGRVEWADMSILKRFWWFVTLLAYSIFCGMIGYVTFGIAVSWFKNDLFWQSSVSLPPTASRIGFGCYAALILIIQLTRVMRSITRTEVIEAGGRTDRPYKLPIYLRCGLQFSILFALAGVAIATALVIVVLHYLGIPAR